ncbi:MAG: hypothetical protein AABY28_00055 [Candidatus Omnitrophota bacterium]
MILHIDMDAFFASIEQAINPRLKGKPLIVGSRNSKMHTVVCAASYEAKALGIDSGMNSNAAFKLCPALEFVAADQGKYIWTSEQILEMISGYGLEVAYVSIDEFQIDIANYAQPLALAQDIQKQIYANFNITASIGIAKNCLLAKLASKLNKPNGITILSEENLTEILGKTPVKKLCGVGAVTEAVLTGIGIKTCLDLYEKPPQFLEQIFGKNGLNLYANLHATERLNQNQGQSPGEANDLTLTGTVPSDKPKSIGHSYTFPMASLNTGFIRAWIRLLSEMVGVRIRQQNLTAKTVHLWLNGPEIGNFLGQKTFQQATNDSFEIYQRALKIMGKRAQKMPKIRALGVTCSNLTAQNYPPLFKEQKRREELLKAFDKINTRFGEGSIYPAITDLTRRMK